MFGLEKDEKRKEFSFDLEEEVKSNPKKSQELLKKISNQIDDIKTNLKEKKSKDSESLGVLLNGYIALEKVLKRINKS
jgi:hypothetical protein